MQMQETSKYAWHLFMEMKAHRPLGGRGACTSPCREDIGARASIRTCTFACMSDCSYLFGNARAIQDLSIDNTEFLFAEAHQMSH